MEKKWMIDELKSEAQLNPDKIALKHILKY